MDCANVFQLVISGTVSRNTQDDKVNPPVPSAPFVKVPHSVS